MEYFVLSTEGRQVRPRLKPDRETDSLNRALRRGLAVLRAFRPGLSVLTNGDLAERTGFPKSTVSRISGALMEAGLLRQLPGLRGYSPTAACVSLGFAALQALGPRQRVLSRMQEIAEAESVSVSLAIPDGDEMIFVDTFRKARRDVLLHVEPGTRLPMEFTSLGRAALALMPEAERDAQIRHLLQKQKSGVLKLRREIRDSLAQLESHGFCQAAWIPGTVAVSRAAQSPGYPIFAFNCAGSTAQMSQTKIDKRLVPRLFELTELLLKPDTVKVPRRRGDFASAGNQSSRN